MRGFSFYFHFISHSRSYFHFHFFLILFLLLLSNYQNIAEEIHDVLNEIGKQVKFPFALAARESILARQMKRISDATRNMARETTSPFIANFVEANKKGPSTLFHPLSLSSPVPLWLMAYVPCRPTHR
jgi:hypothetical protein